MRSCLFVFLFMLACTLDSFSEVVKKTIQVDNLCKIERIYDDGNKILDLNLISNNTIPFDEQYAENCISEVLTSFINDHSELKGAELQYTTLNVEHDNGKNTALNKRFSLVLKSK